MLWKVLSLHSYIRFFPPLSLPDAFFYQQVMKLCVAINALAGRFDDVHIYSLCMGPYSSHLCVGPGGGLRVREREREIREREREKRLQDAVKEMKNEQGLGERGAKLAVWLFAEPIPFEQQAQQPPPASTACQPQAGMHAARRPR